MHPRPDRPSPSLSTCFRSSAAPGRFWRARRQRCRPARRMQQGTGRADATENQTENQLRRSKCLGGCNHRARGRWTAARAFRRKAGMADHPSSGSVPLNHCAGPKGLGGLSARTIGVLHSLDKPRAGGQAGARSRARLHEVPAHCGERVARRAPCVPAGEVPRLQKADSSRLLNLAATRLRAGGRRQLGEARKRSFALRCAVLQRRRRPRALTS